MAAMRKQACLFIFVLCLTLSTVQARWLNYTLIGSRTTSHWLNYTIIGSKTPPCSPNQPEKCVTHSPPANQQNRPCNEKNHCRSGKP
ncbi:hypothetical protein COLO4_11383 [Corchorus olitorius]|uniref:Rapid ALkalinization Factor n=1 Tax=Corchorus olitorius TaxID=93759 RepID=A0A1R3K4P9_9ROSI|nr:hypothetical protein COLO4_11383 [Corchorus olitorius]